MFIAITIVHVEQQTFNWITSFNMENEFLFLWIENRKKTEKLDVNWVKFNLFCNDVNDFLYYQAERLKLNDLQIKSIFRCNSIHT